MVTYVVDGDTVWVRPADGGKSISIRVDGIDAPEICQAGGTISRDALQRRALGQRVVVEGRRYDDYARLLARIVLNGEDLGAWMVMHGQAWSYRYRDNPGPYTLEQRHARTAGLGIFSHAFPDAPIYPRAFRQQHGPCPYIPRKH